MGQLAGELLQDAAQVYDGVVPVGNRAVPRSALDDQVEVRSTLLSHLAGIHRLAVDEQGEATGLVDAVFGVEDLGVFLHHPRHSLNGSSLLVGCRHQHQVALQRHLQTLARQQDLHVDRRRQLGVHRPSSVYEAVGHLPRERRVGPLRRLGGNHVEVRQQQERSLRSVPAQAHY